MENKPNDAWTVIVEKGGPLEGHEWRMVRPLLEDPTYVETLLQAHGRERRLFGVLIIALELSGGTNFVIGSAVADELISYLADQWRTLHFANHAWLVHVCASSLGCAVRCAFSLGQWQRCYQILSYYAPRLPDMTKHEIYWDAFSMCARAHVRANKVAQAEALLRRVPTSIQSQAPQFQAASTALSRFLTKRYEVDEKIPREEMTARILIDTLDAQQPLLQKLRELEQQRGNPALQRSKRILTIERQIQRINSLKSLYARDSSLANVNRLVSERLFAFQQDMRTFLNPKGTFPEENFDWVESTIQSTSRMSHLDQWTTAHRQVFLNQLIRSKTWCEHHGDQHGTWLLLWSLCLAYDQLGDVDRRRRTLSELHESLYMARMAIADTETKSNIANFLPSISVRSFQWLSPIDDIKLIASCAELTKARSLLSSRADGANLTALSNAGPNALGEGIHYTGYTVSEYYEQVFMLMYTADGQLSAHTCSIAPDVIRKLVATRADPSRWRYARRGHRGSGNVQNTLSPLLNPLREGLRQGRLAVGDQVCIAADDPINLISLQYLSLGDEQLAVDLFAFTRVASFSDAMSIARSEHRFPQRGIGLFIPADDKAEKHKQQQFGSVLEALSGRVVTVRRIAGAHINRDAVLDALRPDSLIHVDAHGYFSDRDNPFVSSGIVVARDNANATRYGDAPHLLSPSDLINADRPLQGSHVTLQACVQGLGRPGMGGDVLGMEFALRWQGAASVLAAHWNIRWSMANKFTEAFYKYWLVDKKPRGMAWRQAILDLKTGLPNAEAAEWCAFSLFGDWR